MGKEVDPRSLFLDVAALLAADPPAPLSGAPSGDPLVPQLAAVLGQARGVVAALNSLLPGEGIDDLNKYDHLAGMLDSIAGFQSFSLAEYTYHLAGARRPGVRLWLEEADWQRQVKVLLFPQVGPWQTDGQGRKLSHQLLALRLEPTGIVAAPAPQLSARFSPSWGWEQCLAKALCLPATPDSLPAN